MAKLFKLNNLFKNYEWGSAALIPWFLGKENLIDNVTPWAEMWMGTHSGAPSTHAHSSLSLGEIAGGELPFLFKLLAADKPLSIQAHPDKSQAEKGFLRENSASIALDAPWRSYKDPNHKPEILCALTPFTVMCGFRKPKEIFALLKEFVSAPQSSMPQAVALQAAIEPLLTALQSGGGATETNGAARAGGQLRAFFHALFNMTKTQRAGLGAFLADSMDADRTISGEQWKFMRTFAAQYPEDPAVLSPLYLNLFTLESGQAIFIPAGILHSYISGMALELMTNSDNVIRGGLTPKHIDIPELFNVLDFSPYMPQIFSPPSSPSWFRYPVPFNDFSLFFMRSDGEKKDFPKDGPAICIVTDGELYVCGMDNDGIDNAERHFKKGESFFIPRGASDASGAIDERGALLTFEGKFSLYAAAI